MCLATFQTKPEILKKDRIVWKMVDLTTKSGVYFSYVQKFKYIVGKLYKTNIKISKDEMFADWVAISAYYKKPETVFYGKGFHFYTQKKRARDCSDGLIVKCTIPAGSEYYLDSTGLGVANQIIIN